MKLFDRAWRALTRAPKPQPQRRFELIEAHDAIRHELILPELDFAPPPERPSIPARVIQVQGTYGRNAVEPLPKRRRR